LWQGGRRGRESLSKTTDEIRIKEYLTPDYFADLARHNVAHVFSAWTRMPTLADQIALPGAFTTDFTVVRALLQKGRSYEQAVKLFEPYREVQQPDPATRDALRRIVSRALQGKLESVPTSSSTTGWKGTRPPRSRRSSRRSRRSRNSRRDRRWSAALYLFVRVGIPVSPRQWATRHAPRSVRHAGGERLFARGPDIAGPRLPEQ
jgi:hypothetical protein